MKSIYTTVLAISLACCEPHFLFAQGCLGMDGVSGVGGGVTKIQNGDACANLDANGAIIQVQVGNVFTGDLVEYRIQWNDGTGYTPWTVVPMIGVGVHQVNSSPHFFPTTGTSCEYTPLTYIRVNGMVCYAGSFGIPPVYHRWNREGGSNSGSSNFIVTSIASTDVAAGLTEVIVEPGEETVVTFQDLSNFNCNTSPGDVIEPSNRNNTRRWRQFEYGGTGDLNSISGGVTVGSVHVAPGTSFEGPLLTYAPITGAPAGVAGGVDDPFTDSSFGLDPISGSNTTDAITIPATAQLGEVFVVTTHFWNGCNRADQGNAPFDYAETKIIVGSSLITSVNGLGETTKGRVRAYPNPVADHFSVSSSKGNGISSVRLYDLTGRVVFESLQVEAGSFDIHHIPSGVYVLEVRSQSGSTERSKLSKI